MSDFHLVTVGGFIIVVSGLLAVIMQVAFSRKRVFKPVKALNLRPGVYQNRRNGNIIEVRSFNDNMAFATDGNGCWNIRYDILNAEYTFLGQL